MNVVDILLVVVIAAVVLIGVRQIIKRGKGGCGCCDNCSNGNLCSTKTENLLGK